MNASVSEKGILFICYKKTVIIEIQNCSMIFQKADPRIPPCAIEKDLETTWNADSTFSIIILISPIVEIVFEPIPTNLRTRLRFTQISDFKDVSLIKFTLDPVSTRKMSSSGENAEFSNFTNGAGPKFLCSSSLKTTRHSGRDLNWGSS